MLRQVVEPKCRLAALSFRAHHQKCQSYLRPAPLQRPLALSVVDCCFLGCPVQPHMAVTQAVEITLAALLDVAAVVLGQKGLTGSGCQSGLGQPDCLPGRWWVVRVDHSCEH